MEHATADDLDDLDAEWSAFGDGAEGDDTGTPFGSVDEDPPRIEDEHQADRMLRRIDGLYRAEAKVLAFVDRELKRLREFVEDRLAGNRRERARLEASLEAWIMGQPAKVKTVTLPNGQIRRRARRAKVEVLDETDAAAMALHAIAPAVVRVKHEVVKSQVNDELQAGPVVEGAIVESGYRARAALLVDADTGESTTVPGLLFLEPTDDLVAFGYSTPSKPKDK